MHVFEMVVIIVVAALAAGLIKEFMRQKQKNNERMEGMDERLSRIDDLEKRVRVLEKIVTDKNYSLKRELDELAD